MNKVAPNDNREVCLLITCLLNGEKINCLDGNYTRDELKKLSKEKKLKCPVCGEQYTYNHGKIKSPYFKHLNSECSLYGEPETEEHILGKNNLYQWLLLQDGVEDVVLEGYIKDTEQRPDIMFKFNGERYVIEYQCTPIATEYYERHEKYQSLGVKDIWILGVEKYTQYHSDKSTTKRMSEIEKNCNKYYDPFNDLLIFRDEKLEYNRYSHKVLDLDDVKYVSNKINLYPIKSGRLDYERKNKHTSRGWRTEYKYICNKSLGYCKKLKYMKIQKEEC